MKHFVLTVFLLGILVSIGTRPARAGWVYQPEMAARSGSAWNAPPVMVPVLVYHPGYGYYYAYVPAMSPGGFPGYQSQSPQPYASPQARVPLYGLSQQPSASLAPARRVFRPTPAPPPQNAKAEQPAKSKVQEELDQARRERDEAWNELAKWAALGVTLDQVKAFQEQLARLQSQNTFLVRQNTDLDFRLSRYEGPEREVPMPSSVKGKVLAVDSKYHFVVLDIGGNQGVATNGKLLVDRNGKLVGKLRVTKVESNASIANVLQDWKVADIREGDQVIHQ